MFFNPNDKGGSTVLTNSFRTATQTHGSDAWRSVRGVEPKSSGKWFFSILVVSNGGTVGNLLIGIATCRTVLDNYFGRNNHAFVRTDDGRDLFQNVNVASGLTAFADGDVVDCAVDLDNQRIWFRVNGGNWEDSGAADPATNTGGRDISAMPSLPVYPALGLFYNTASATITAGTGPFTYAPPSGFTGWDLQQPNPSDTAMRYWRIEHDRTNTNTFTSLGEIEGRVVAAGAQQFTGGTPSQDTTPFVGEEADKAIDGSAATRATFGQIVPDGTGNQVLPHGWQYDFGAGVTRKIVQVVITCRSDGFANAAPNTFKFMASTDGVHWVMRHRQEGEAAWGLGEARTFNIADVEYPAITDALSPPQLVNVNEMGALAIGLSGALLMPQIVNQNVMGDLAIGLSNVDRLFPPRIVNVNQLGALAFNEIERPTPYVNTTVIMS